MLLCLVVCLTLLASFFLPSHLSLKHKCVQNETNALLLAISNNKQEKIVNALLDKNPELDIQDKVDSTQWLSSLKEYMYSFAIACYNVNTCISFSDWPSCYSVPNLYTYLQYGETALIFACKMKNLRLVKRILSMGADPDIANKVREPIVPEGCGCMSTIVHT